MRAGASGVVQQTLTTEAASVLKHSLTLARRRGHAQITPLHVAFTLLTSRFSLFKRACLKSHPHQSSHPLHSKALDLCFNVALNRLPTAPSGPLLHGQPSLSNALIAALKRAQAHQKRGCLEQQQQQQQQTTLFAIKVELEQLIFSILDDPSVSRVMREAGFSSIAVKNNLDDCLVSSVFQCYSTSNGGIYSTPSSPPRELMFSPHKRIDNSFSFGTFEKDIKVVMEVLLRKKKRNAVIVGDTMSTNEAFVQELMNKVERGDVHEDLKSAHFIRFQLSSAPLSLMRKEEVERNILGLKSKVDDLVLGGRGVIVYIGDLKWAVEVENKDLDNNNSNYRAVDHLVEEIGRFICGCSSLKVWLMATATYHTYMRSQMMQPNLDSRWSLQAVPVPSNGLGLSLSAARFESVDKNPFSSREEQDKLTCCGDCALNYEKELGLKSSQQKSCSIYSTSCNSDDFDKVPNELPYWLRSPGRNSSDKDESVELKRKWSRLCQTLHKGRNDQDHTTPLLSHQCYLGKNYGYNTHSRWPGYNGITDTKSISFASADSKPNQSYISVPRFRRQQSCHIEFNFSDASSKTEQTMKMGSEDKQQKITLALGSCVETEHTQSDASICKILQECVPWQSESVQSIVQVLMDSRSANKDKWFLIQGSDSVGKRKLAQGIAETVFGSAESLLDVSMRSRDTSPSCWIEILENAFKVHEKIAVFVEDVHLASSELLNFLADAYRRGELGGSSAREGKCRQVVFILTMFGSKDHRDELSTINSVMEMRFIVHEKTSKNSGLGGLVSDHKRKGEWDCSGNGKSPRKDGMECVENEKDCIRKLSSNTLDLNIKADEQETEDSHNEMANDHHQTSLSFLALIKNRFVFNRDPIKDRQMRDMFLSRIRSYADNVLDINLLHSFTVEENLLQDICLESARFSDSLFQNWLKEIFTRSLVGICKKEGINVRLCLGCKNGLSDPKDGYQGSCLPNYIQVCFMD